MSQAIFLTPTSGPGSGTVTSITFNGGLTSSPDPVTTTGTATIDQTNLTVQDGTVYWDTGTQLLNTTATGTSGQILTSQGSGLPPIYADATGGGGITTINVDQSGSVTGSTIDLFANSGSANAGSSVNFIAVSGTEIDLQVTDPYDNTIIGLASGNGSITGSQNTSVGWLNYTALTSGSDNTALGITALRFLVDGNLNTAIGAGTLSSITSGVGNTALGFGSGPGSGDVSQNIFIGQQAGLNYAGGEANNILIGTYQLGGTVGEANTLRIGNGTGSSIGQLSQAYVAGINGVTLGGTPLFVTIDPTTDQLGVTSGGGGGGVTINCDVGSATGSTLALYAHTGFALAGSSVAFIGGVTEIDLQMTDINDNTMIGSSAGNSTMSGANNTAVGNNSLLNLTSGISNTAMGNFSLNALADGSNNVSIGNNSGSVLVSGSDNTCLGQFTGNNYLGAESSNILIGSNVVGTPGESFTLRIGAGTGDSSAGQLSQAFIAGINGVTLGGTPNVVTIDPATDQLGVAALPSSGSLILIQTQTIPSGLPVAEIDFTTGITSSYNNYFLTFDNIVIPAATGLDNLVLQVSANGGSTYDSTNYTIGITPATGIYILQGTASTYFISGNLYLYNVTSGTNYILGNVSSTIYDTSVPQVFGGGTLTGYTVVNTVVNALRIVMDDGTLLSGTVSLYGIAQLG
jgi:hypothetical protein